MGIRVVLGWNFENPFSMKPTVSACSFHPVIRDGTLSWETILRESHLSLKCFTVIVLRATRMKKKELAHT